MTRPQFTLRDLLFGTTLIAIGLGGAVLYIRKPDLPDAVMLIVMPIALGHAAFIGAGVMAPFHKKVWGACLGYALEAIVLFAVAFTIRGLD